MPRAVWRAVRAKNRCSKFMAWGWGSLAAIWTMAQAAKLDEDLLVCTSTILVTTYCLRITETASIRVQNVDPTQATICYFDKKTRRCWITRLASTYIVRLMGFARAVTLRLGRKPLQPLIKGGVKALQAAMVRLLGEGHLQWHCLRCLGATLLIRHGATVQELLAWGRWRAVKAARRYVATWEDSPWTDEHLPRPALVEGQLGKSQFIQGTTEMARSLWPMFLAAGRKLDGWRFDGSDLAESVAQKRWDILTRNLHYVEYEGASFLSTWNFHRSFLPACSTVPRAFCIDGQVTEGKSTGVVCYCIAF